MVDLQMSGLLLWAQWPLNQALEPSRKKMETLSWASVSQDGILEAHAFLEIYSSA